MTLMSRLRGKRRLCHYQYLIMYILTVPPSLNYPLTCLLAVCSLSDEVLSYGFRDSRAATGQNNLIQVEIDLQFTRLFNSYF